MALLITAPATALLELYAQAVSVSGNSVPTLLWQNNFNFPPDTKTAGRYWSSPTVADGIVYISAASNINNYPYPYYPNPPPGYVIEQWSDFYAFNASNGAKIWDYRDPSPSIQQSVAVADGVVFFGAGFPGPFYNGTVFALNASNGKLLWSYTINADVSSPVVANGMVYFTGSSTLYALNATNGDKIWDAPNYGRTSPKIVNGVLYISSASDYNLYALNANNGERIWNYTTEFWASTPVVAGGAVYFSADKNIYALNAATGIKLWNYSTTVVLSNYGYGFDYEFSSPTVANDVVYIFSTRAQNLYALKASNGAKFWNYTRAVGDPPTVADGIVYVSFDGNLCALNAYNGTKIWDYSGFGTPAVADGILYFAASNDIYALKLPLYAPSPSDLPAPEPLPTDRTPPEIKILSPVNQTYNEPNVSLVFTVNELVNWMGYSLDAQSNVTLVGNLTLPELSFGLHNVTVYATDLYGNTGASETVNFTLVQPQEVIIVPQQSKSFPTTYVIAAVVTVAVVVIGLTVYFKKRKRQAPNSQSK